MSAPATTNERAPGDGYLVLWVGSTDIAERDAQVELRRAGVRVEVAGPEELASRVAERAPDLIVLGGAAGEDPDPLVRELAATKPEIPAVALVPSSSAAPRPRSRYGLVARLDRTLDPPALASHLSALLAGLSTRSPVWRVSARPGDLGPLASRFASSGRSGILAIDGGAIAISAGGPIAPAKLEIPDPGDASERALTAHFHERPSGRVRTSASATAGDAHLEGARVLVIDGDAERRERVTRRLESAGAQVRATGLVAQAVHASRALDPAVVVVAASALRSSAVAPLWNEPRLAAASLLVLDGAELDDDALPRAVVELAEPELSLATRLRAKQAVAERLETFGPARWLKLLGPCTHDVTLRVFAAAGRARVDLAGGRIQGASFRPREDDAAVVDGRAAVDALMTLQFGRVLAGPPDALAALEGVSARRKPSVVGRIEPTPSSGVRRNHGLVAKEVVVKRVDRTARPTGSRLRRETPAAPEARSAGASAPTHEPAEPKLERAPVETLPEIESAPAVSIADLAEGNDLETGSYAPEVLDALRAELSGEAPRQAAGAPDAAPEGVAVAAKPEPIEAPIVTTQLAPPSAPSTPLARRRSGNAPWIVAGVALAIGAGGWAAWRLRGEPAATPVEHAHTPPESASDVRDTRPVSAAPSAPAPLAEAGEPAPLAEAGEPAPLAEAGEPAAEAIVEASEPATAQPLPEPAATVEAQPAGMDAPALIEEAREAGRAGDYARAEVLSRQALALSPRNPRAGYRLAVALFRLDRHDEALAQCELTSRWDPDDPLPHALVGDIHSRRGRFNLAARAYRRALEAEPRFRPAQRALDRLAARGVE